MAEIPTQPAQPAGSDADTTPAIIAARPGPAATNSTGPEGDASPSLPSIRSEQTTPRQRPRKPVRTPAETISLPDPDRDSGAATPAPVVKSLPFPTPKQPSKCPLFCCFYAEFDNKVGPKISYESPEQFMSQDIQVPLDEIHAKLEETFDRLQKEPVATPEQTAHSTPNTDNRRRKVSLAPEPESLHSSLSTVERVNTEEIDDSHPEASLSIFDSCSEYIITGSELSDQTLNLSTHYLHILTRPTIIANEKYERNALLFCLGFVLRRTEDPRPFRPALSKLADTLRDMEIESQFLSANKNNNTELQHFLEWTLCSLNSAKWECNLYLNAANVLNLKLFHPPKPLAPPVVDYAVPIFLRRDWHFLTYEWDLSINWVSLHIDGVTNARQISQRSEVDMEMVQACLRVLRHHKVIALVDIFQYTNRYEATDKAAALLAGKHHKLLQDAVDFVFRRQTNHVGNEASPTTGSPLGRRHHSSEGKEGSPSHLGDAHHPGSFRFASSSLFSHPESHSGLSTRRPEYHDVKIAVSEFYAACHRGISVGELWISLIGRNRLPGEAASLNWKKMFHLIDHRRLTSFGLIHGLIKRVHDYPVILNNPFAFYNRSGPLHRGRFGGPRALSRDDSDEHRRRLQSTVAACLDGRHCEDDLICRFECPYDDLLSLFPDEKIIHMYATESP